MFKHTLDARSRRTAIARPLFAGLAVLAVFGSFRAGRMLPHKGIATSPTSQINAGPITRKARSRATATTVDEPSSVEIIPHIQQNMFPDDWTDPSSPTSATAPEQELVPNAVAGVKRALRKYPAAFLKKNLTRVYIVNNLLVDGQPSGGVNAPEMKTIYVDLDNLDDTEVAAWSEETIHHEFAHLLADNHPGNISMLSWASLNRPSFKYGNGGTDAIRIGKDGDEIKPEYLSQGFVEEYSKSDPNEDFATLCERLFSGDRTVQSAVARFPILRRKANKAIAFYHSLDPSFTASYFRRSSRPGRQSYLRKAIHDQIGER